MASAITEKGFLMFIAVKLSLVPCFCGIYILRDHRTYISSILYPPVSFLDQAADHGHVEQSRNPVAHSAVEASPPMGSQGRTSCTS
ncbi:hypothetical protein NC652_029478 [Populus alba x Populus x berolinensis]|nr:hypothetical protein NC652_029478 [Populus alba x Populus x berolinensis]